MKQLSSEVRKKAEAVLRLYGGLDGLSNNPPWVIGIVLRTWFSEEERKEILRFLFRGMKKPERLPLLSELGTW